MPMTLRRQPPAMCIGFWTLTHPEYALILAANRDEFLSRPTLPAEWHAFGSSTDPADILSGRDVAAGGTWLGMNKHGEVGLLTNITELIAKFASSRGELVSDFLKPTSSRDSHLSHYLASVLDAQRTYAGFNLLLLSPKSRADDGAGVEYRGAIATNSHGGGEIVARPLTEDESAWCGLSNSNDCAEPLRDHADSEWPKVSEGKALFRRIVGRDKWDQDELVESLFDMMSTQNPIPPTSRYSLRTTIAVPPIQVKPRTWSDSITPDVAPASNDAAPALKGDRRDYYATRLTTVVLVGKDGSAVFVERDVWQMVEGQVEPAKADKSSQRLFKFRVEKRDRVDG